MNNELEALKFPIGRFKKPIDVSMAEIELAIKAISDFPEKIHIAVERLVENQLDTPYRPDGWTIRQVVHHCADSHINAYIRFKLALTEEIPTIKPYEQDRWAALIDSQMLPLDISLAVLKGIHTRWVVILKNMTDPDWERTFIHPEHGAAQSLKRAIKMYEWHGEHHLAHITTLKERMGWE